MKPVATDSLKHHCRDVPIFGSSWCITRIGFFLIFCLVTCPTFGQGKQKAAVSEEDYHLWGTLYFDKISPKGKWVSYNMVYDEHADTLFVKSTGGHQNYKFPEGYAGAFGSEQYFACLVPDEQLKLTHLASGQKQMIPGVVKFSFSADGRFLITIETKNNVQELVVRMTSGFVVVDKFEGITDYKLNNAGDVVLVSCQTPVGGSVFLLRLGDSIVKTVVAESPQDYSALTWQENGASAAFLEHSKNIDSTEHNAVLQYVLKNKKIYRFGATEASGVQPELFVANGSASRLTISRDGSKIFFGLLKKNVSSKYRSDEVQVWNGNDTWIYPQRKKNIDWEENSKLACWWPAENRFLQICDDDQPFVFLNGSQDYAITYNPMALESQYKLLPNTDFYITELRTGERRLWLANQSTEANSISISPSGKYATYHCANDWWVYDFISRTHTNVTKRPDSFFENDQAIGGREIYGIAGWDVADVALVYYDSFDLCKVNPDGSNFKELTDGKSRNVSFRIVKSDDQLNGMPNFDGRTDPIINASQDILLEAKGITSTGFFKLGRNGFLEPIGYGECLYTQLVKAPESNVYVFIKQQFDIPPALYIKAGNKKAATLLVQSNIHYNQYLCGETKAIRYKNGNGISMNGILYYPAGYDPLKKYPMVVHIYEAQFDRLHNYINPSSYNANGFNIANLTASGYFVLLPDIKYAKGDPGRSAADCVQAAVLKVFEMDVVLRDKIGLIGHSFGGYETNFIITQTNLFAAAVSGAGVADLASHYLSVGWSTGLPEIWRFENQQWRMGKSLFEDREAYDRNSPIRYAANIKTPLLLWAGEQDRQVHYYQSIVMYLALKRLNKKQIMLIYPGNPHVLLVADHQKDLTRKIANWFSYFLKDEAPSAWITQGLEEK